MEGIVQDIISEEDSEKYYDGGLFTGETVLHIAIVQNSSHEDLVPWLLERNCNVVARAHGAFFKPKTFYLPSDKNPEKNKGDWFFRPLISLMEGFERRLGWGRRVDANKKQVEKRVAGHKNRRRIENLDSACDYGELPLSFAASVGRLDVCKALLKHVMSGIVEDEDAREEQERSYIRELEEIYKREEKTTKDWKTFIKSCREKYPKSKSKIRPFENKTWKEFVEVTREQLMAQNIELGHKKRTAEMREEFLKNLTEMPVDTQLAEDGVAQKMEKMFQEVKDNHCQKVTFYFVNASVDNFYYQEGTQHKIRYGGNTALHMAVYHRQTDVIKWLMEKGAEPSLKFMNEHNLTPFTLAAKQGYVEIFDVLTDYMRQKSWVYGQVQMSLLSLEQLDSFRIGEFPLHQNTAWQSAIEVRIACLCWRCRA